jgi:hypothetical protein
MSFTRGTSHHQRARAHEARPEPPDAAEELFGIAINSGDEILVENKVGLYRADVLAVTDDKVAVVKFTLSVSSRSW